MKKTTTIECECQTPGHLVNIISYEDGSVFFEVSLSHYILWYKRVVEAIKYIFGASTVSYDGTVIKREDMDHVIDLLNQAKKDVKQD